MEEFLRFVMGRLAEFPDEVVITRAEAPENPEKVTFLAAMRQSDIPRIIGKGGHTIQAIRALLEAAAQRQGLKVALEIIE